MLQPINLISFFPRNMAVELPDLWGDTVTHEILKNMGIKNPYFFDGFTLFLFTVRQVGWWSPLTFSPLATCGLRLGPKPVTSYRNRCQIECQKEYRNRCHLEWMPDRIPEKMSEILPASMSDRMFEFTPERMPDRMSEYMPESMSDRMSD